MRSSRFRGSRGARTVVWTSRPAKRPTGRILTVTFGGSGSSPWATIGMTRQSAAAVTQEREGAEPKRYMAASLGRLRARKARAALRMRLREAGIHSKGSAGGGFVLADAP